MCLSDYLRKFEIRSSQFIDINLQYVTEVYEHVRGALCPASDVQARRDHVGVLATSENKILKVISLFMKI